MVKWSPVCRVYQLSWDLSQRIVLFITVSIFMLVMRIYAFCLNLTTKFDHLLTLAISSQCSHLDFYGCRCREPWLSPHLYTGHSFGLALLWMQSLSSWCIHGHSSIQVLGKIWLTAQQASLSYNQGLFIFASTCGASFCFLIPIGFGLTWPIVVLTFHRLLWPFA